MARGTASVATDGNAGNGKRRVFHMDKKFKGNKKKWMALLVSGFLLLAAGALLQGCRVSHGIPNGKYVFCNDSGEFTAGENYDYFWRIKGNKANYHASGDPIYECKIVMEDDRIYFEFAGKGYRDAFKNEAKYDETTKILTVHMPKSTGGSIEYFKCA
jgi:hypothetical protein